MELAGIEPASGQSAAALSTCLVFDWIFECGLVQKRTHPHLILCVSPFDRGVPSGNPALFLMRGGLCSRHQGLEGPAWREAHAAQRLSNSLELGSHGILIVASYCSVVIFCGVTNHAPACLRSDYTFPSIPSSPNCPPEGGFFVAGHKDGHDLFCHKFGCGV